MSTLLADTANVVEALKKVADTDIHDDEMRVSVYDCEVVMRGITHDKADERNLFGNLGEQVCRFTYDGTSLTLSFHESQVETTFCLTPAGSDAVAPRQATSPKELAPMVGEVLRSIEREWDIVSYDFTEVSAGSIGTGHFTDFEFEYEVTTTEF